MSEQEHTTVTVKLDTYQRLNGRKRPGDSFDDVITRLLNATEGEGIRRSSRERDLSEDIQRVVEQSDESGPSIEEALEATYELVHERGAPTGEDAVLEFVYPNHGSGRPEPWWNSMRPLIEELAVRRGDLTKTGHGEIAPVREGDR